ncbi:MAG TPA: hypothetical protein VE776_02690 [Actinomycetota bacterium]|nr:hypothetical protein [Actinomycetota bacterium]
MTRARGLSRGLLVATGFLGLMGAGYAGSSVQANSLRQRIVPARLLGRVTSVHRTVTVGVAPLGAILGGLAARRFGIRSPYLLGGGGPLVAGMLALAFLDRHATGTRPGVGTAATGPVGSDRE